MSNVFYLRPIDPPITPEHVQGMVAYAGGCFDLHRVDWKHSFLSVDGGRMLCWYTAPDAEAARLALRELGSKMNAVWAGTVTGNGPDSPSITAASVVAEMSFSAAVSDQEVARLTFAIEREGVRLVRGFLSNRRTRWVNVLDAADERAAAGALDRAGLDVEALWSCTPITPVRAL